MPRSIPDGEPHYIQENRALRRRNMFRVGVAYLVVACSLVLIIVSMENLPGWADTVAITPF